MADLEHTLCMIKSKALRSNLCGNVFDRIIFEDFTIIRAKRVFLSPEYIGQLYYEHMQRPYWNDLADSVSHGVVVMALLREDAIQHWRTTMGATNPKEAVPGTIRYWARSEKRMADNIVHGSATEHDARRELRMFFPGIVL